jgi:acyl carrier protein
MLQRPDAWVSDGGRVGDSARAVRIANELYAPELVLRSMRARSTAARALTDRLPYEAPRDPIEATVADIWERVLGLDRVGIHENFFQIGGNSIALTQMASQVRAELGYLPSLGALFQVPTVAALAAAIAASHAPPDDPELERLLDQAENMSAADVRVLLASERPTAEALAPAALSSREQALAERITTVGCPTRNRPAALQRCLDSYAEHCVGHGHAPRFLVVFDDDDAETSESCHRIVSSVHARHGLPIALAGRREKAAFVQALAAIDAAPADVVEFGLFGAGLPEVVEIGANRNTLLLSTLGEQLFSVDDDTLCLVADAPAADDHPAVSQALSDDPWEIWSFPDRDAALRHATFVDRDALAAHGALVGRAVADVGDLPPDPGGRIRITVNGLLGDCGWGSPAPYLELDDASLRRLTASSDVYRRAVCSREVLRTTRRIGISSGIRNFMTTFAAIDNDRSLPPFNPVGRGSDRLFATMVSACDPYARFASLPWALLHLPIEMRRFSPGEILRSASGIDFVTLIEILVRDAAQDMDGLASDARMRHIGQHLRAFARRSPRECVTALRSRVASWARDRIQSLDAARDAHPRACDAWLSDVDAYAAQLHTYLVERDGFVPLDLMYGRNRDEATTLTLQLIERFGSLLYWWPNITEGARELRQRGCVLERPIH